MADKADRRQAADLAARLRAEEPAPHLEDTSPRAPVAARWPDEPPRAADDTNPNLRVPPSLLSEEWPPRPRREHGGSWMQRAVALAMMASAVLLAAAAALIWLDGRDADAPAPDRDQAVSEASPFPTPTAPLPSTDAPTAIPAAPAALAQRATPPVLPTAAADEVAAALLTPVPQAVSWAAIPRGSEPFTIRPASGRTDVTLYTVQDGDTLDSIAAQFELKDMYTLIWSNKASKYSPLRTGAQLNILPVDGVYHEVTEPLSIADLAEMYGVDPYAIIDSAYNDALFGSVPETLLPTGMWVIVPGGEAERALFLPGNPNAGSVASGGTISGSYTLWGCTSNISGGSPPYSRPLSNYKWVRGFDPGGHTGVDLSARKGDNVYAAGGGTVAYAGWSDGGYGNVVVLAHGGSFSIYGHLSSVNVRCGGQVGAGQVVGFVGSTGNSSGEHLHFEVRDADWNAMNPQNWVGF